MPENEIVSVEKDKSLEVLDDLIERSYKQLLNTYIENAKIGELLKMIELRNKLAPTRTEQQEFWEHIDKIRREQLNAKGNGNTRTNRRTKQDNKAVSSKNE